MRWKRGEGRTSSVNKGTLLPAKDVTPAWERGAIVSHDGWRWEGVREVGWCLGAWGGAHGPPSSTLSTPSSPTFPEVVNLNRRRVGRESRSHPETPEVRLFFVLGASLVVFQDPYSFFGQKRV